MAVSSIHEYDEEDWNRILRVDLTGVFVVSKAIVPSLLKRGGGVVIGLGPESHRSEFGRGAAA